jgi:hypothetical protein
LYQKLHSTLNRKADVRLVDPSYDAEADMKNSRYKETETKAQDRKEWTVILGEAETKLKGKLSQRKKKKKKKKSTSRCHCAHVSSSSK